MNSLCISVAEAAKTLGISKRSLYSYVEAGVFPSVRIGRRILIRKIDMDRIVNGQPAAPPQQVTR
jgi:excisionase family DNA binding protein